MSAKIYDVLVRMPENQRAREVGTCYSPIMTVVGTKWNLWSLWARCCDKKKKKITESFLLNQKTETFPKR